MLPVLTVFGERNDPAPFQRRWSRPYPNAQQVAVPQGYHFPMIDDPQLFADADPQADERAGGVLNGTMGEGSP